MWNPTRDSTSAAIALPVALISNEPPQRLLNVAESGDLQAMTQRFYEQPPGQMRG
jgi:hypothetical protein